MKKKYIELSAEEFLARLKENPTSIPYRHVKDSEIDFSDIPELTPHELKKMRRLGRPLLGHSPRVAVNIRLDSDVLKKIKSDAKKKGMKYQTYINEILKKVV